MSKRICRVCGEITTISECDSWGECKNCKVHRILKEIRTRSDNAVPLDPHAIAVFNASYNPVIDSLNKLRSIIRGIFKSLLKH